MLDEQRRQQKEIIDILLRRTERGTGDTAASPEDISVPSAMAALSNRVELFVFDADMEMSFSRWHSRYKDVFTEDARHLPRRDRLPRNGGHHEAAIRLQRSEFTTKYQCLKLKKSDAEDYLTYTDRVNEFCEKARLHDLDSDGIKCLLSIFGLKSSREADIRQRLIELLDREYKAGRTVSLQGLYRECENFLNLKTHSDTIADNEKIVEAAKLMKKSVECWHCGEEHYASDYKKKPWFRNKCKTRGHQERFCGVANQKKEVLHMLQEENIDVTARPTEPRRAQRGMFE